jgi:hypothetical protein
VVGAYAMSASRFVKIVFGDGRIKAINMTNVTTVTRHANAITIQYNVSYGGGKSFMGSGGVNTMPYYETINYANDEDATDVFQQLIG